MEKPSAIIPGLKIELSKRNPITTKDLSKHYPQIIGSSGSLRTLNGDQIFEVAMLMEQAYRKGLKGGDPNEREHRE